MNGLRAVFSDRWRDFRPGRLSPLKEQPLHHRPRLLVDVSVISQHDAQTGIQRVVRALWTHLRERSGDEFDLVPVFATGTHPYRATCPDFLERPAGRRRVGHAVTIRPGDKFLGLDLSAHLLPAYKRQIKSWRSKGATTHIVVYDLLPLQRPDWFNEKSVRHFRRWFKMVREHSDQLLCISDQVAEGLRDALGAGAKPVIGRIRMAGDIEGSRPSRGIDQRVGAMIEQMRKRQTILMVGTIEPRKGYDIALAAFEYLWQNFGPDAPSLVIVGKPGWRTSSLQELLRSHPEQGRRLFWLSDVSDEGLGQLYEACAGVFLASHAEGFGLPGIEAAMHGRHALVRNLAVFQEQKLPNLMFFQDDSPETLACKLIELTRASPIPRPAGGALPSWSDSVDALVEELCFSGETAVDTPWDELANFGAFDVSGNGKDVSRRGVQD